MRGYRQLPLNPIEADEFAALMAGLGPLGPNPRLAIAVSGGADSVALAVLAQNWTLGIGGEVLAIILDHGLRSEAAAEAEVTKARLAAIGIAAAVLRLHGLVAGAGTAKRARAMRLGVLEAACAELGIVFLLLGHHGADQAETLLLRSLDGSGGTGLAAMAVRRENSRIVLLRPLLSVPPGRLRATLAARGLGWVEDPSNANPAFGRARLRVWRKDACGSGFATIALGAAAAAHGSRRALDEQARNRLLAERVSLYPEGYARLAPGPLSPVALSSLLRALSGATFAPSEARVAALATCPRPATLAGIRLLPAGRLGPGWLLVREARAMAPPVPAIAGVRWDGRFRLHFSARPPPGAMLGALGPDAAQFRAFSGLPAAILVTLPALRLGKEVVAVPHLGYPDAERCALAPVLFSPNEPAGGAPFAIACPDGGAEPGL